MAARLVWMHRRWAIGLFSLLPLWASIACGLLAGGAPTAVATPSAAATASPAGEQPTPAVTEAVTPSASAAALPISTQPGELSLEQAIVFGPGSLIYTDTLAGLTTLSSYTARLTVAFSGTRDGQAEQWSNAYVMLATNDPPARQWTVEITGNPADSGTLFLAEMQGTAYERRGEAACTASAVPESNALTERLELASLLTGVIGADEAGTATINDVAAAHYTFDQRALGEDGLTVSTGELWIASEGHYLVRYLLSSTGSAEYFGQGIEGTLTWDYAVTAINQPTTILVPEDCPPGMVNAPLLPDASNIAAVPGLLAYDTGIEVADAAAFYQAQLPGLGWTPDGEPALAASASILVYRQGEQQMTVTLRAEAGRTTVSLVVIGPLPE